MYYENDCYLDQLFFVYLDTTDSFQSLTNLFPTLPKVFKLSVTFKVIIYTNKKYT